MAITLSEARCRLAASIRHGLDGAVDDVIGAYTARGVDFALMFAMNDWAERTRSIRGVTDVPIPSGSHLVDFTATDGMEQFQEFNFIWANIDGLPVQTAPLYSVQREVTLLAASGQPTKLAFEGPTRTWLNKNADDDYNLSVFWWQPATVWEAGIVGKAANETILNIPDRYADAVIQTGAAAKLVAGNPDDLSQNVGWQDYLRFRDQVAAEFRPPTGSFPASEDASRNSPTRRKAAAAA